MSALAVVVGLAALCGCSWTRSVMPSWLSPSSADSKAAAASSASCPTATILRPLAQTVLFAPGAEHTPIGIAFYGLLDDVTAKCEPQGGAIHVSLDVVVIGQRGPAAGAAAAVDLQYFVAVTGPGDAILSKRSLPVHIAIPPGERRAGVTDHLDEMIPLAGRTPGQLTIDVGFQQSPDVVDYFRHFRGR